MNKLLIVILGLAIFLMPLYLLKYVIEPMGIEMLSVVIDPLTIKTLFAITVAATALLVVIAISGARKIVIKLDDFGSFNITHAIRLMKQSNATILKAESNLNGEQDFMAVYVYGKEKAKKLQELLGPINDAGSESVVSKGVDIVTSFGVERLISKKWSLVRSFDTKEEMIEYGAGRDDERLVEIISVPIYVENT